MTLKTPSLDEIKQCLDRIRDERNFTEGSIKKLESEKANVQDRIDDLKRKKVELDDRLRSEIERAKRQDRSLEEAEAMYSKLIESQRNLADFVKKEYQDTRRQN